MRTDSLSKTIIRGPNELSRELNTSPMGDVVTFGLGGSAFPCGKLLATVSASELNQAGLVHS
jgi:hypothetical protein